MTEEEAKEKWCPMAAAHEGTQKCIASKCMAWVDDYESSSEPADLKVIGGHCGMVK